MTPYGVCFEIGAVLLDHTILEPMRFMLTEKSESASRKGTEGAHVTQCVTF